MNTKSWPKYYSNQLILNKGSVALITGWTKKEDVYASLTPESKEKIAVAGQLYSKEGINFVIRNTFLNPRIKFLVITGKDLSGSIKELKSFLSGAKKKFIHEEIDEKKIDEFVSYFSKHHLCAEISELNEKLKDLNFTGKWTDKPVLFPPHLAKKIKSFPSEKTAFRFEGEKIANVWPKVLDAILKFGCIKKSSYSEKQMELINIVTVIDNEDPDNPFFSPYFSFSRKDLINYFPQVMTEWSFEGVEYTYGSRLRNHDRINQIEEIINELKGSHYSRRAIAFTWNVKKDCRNPKPPCLDSVQALVQNKTVYLTAYFRSNDMFRAWPQNAFGLLKIQKEIADALGFKTGKLVVVSCSAHIYERDFLEAQKVIEKHKSFLLETDPRGNFVIEIENKEIIVKHYNLKGVFLQEFRGKTARELRLKISPFISLCEHAIYMGEELAKAEFAMRNNTFYKQS